MTTERKRTIRTTGKQTGGKKRSHLRDGNRISGEDRGEFLPVDKQSCINEWGIPENMLPDFCGKRVLDLGCGDGRYCRYAIEHGAIACTGIDPSEKMLKQAYQQNSSFWTEYRCMAIENVEFEPGTYDTVISPFSFHHIESLGDFFARIHRLLTAGGTFVFSLEHPICTASDHWQRLTGENDEKPHWSIDRYFDEGKRDPLAPDHLPRYHRTLSTVINNLIATGFNLTGLAEPQPAFQPETASDATGTPRQSATLIVSAVKNR